MNMCWNLVFAAYRVVHNMKVLVGCTLHFGLKYELITNLMQLNIYLCTFSSTYFGLTRPSSGAMDVTISLHIQHMVSTNLGIFSFLISLLFLL